MVDGLFFCATLTDRRGCHTPNPFVQAGAETSDTGAEAVKPDLRCSWEGHSGWVGAGVGTENAESCEAVRPLRIPLVIRPMIRTYVVVVKWTNEILCGGYKLGVSIWGTVRLHWMDGWALSRADAQAPWHGTLETVWLHCDETQQVGCLKNWKVVRWCRTQACSHCLQGVVDGGFDEAGMSTAAPDRSTVLCSWMHQD